MTSVPEPGSLVSEALSRLRALIAETEKNRLPPLSVLSQTFGISTVVLAEAARALRGEGLLTFSRGRPLYIAARLQTATAITHGNRAEDVAEKITGDREFRVGDPLPKTRVLALRHGCSQHTVCRALRILVHGGLVHRKGKAFYPGKTPSSADLPSIKSLPVVVIVQDSPAGWRGLATSERTRRFCETFMTEMQRQRCEAHFADLSGTDREKRASLRSVLRQFDWRYRGALSVVDPSVLQANRSLTDMLLSAGKPVVWFDQNDEGGDGITGEPLFTRCRFDEHAAVRLAVETLYQAGHRTAGYVDNGRAAWRAARGDMCVEAARSLEGMRVLLHRGKAFRFGPDPAGKAVTLSRLHRRGLPHVRRLIGGLLAGHRLDPAADPLAYEALIQRGEPRSVSDTAELFQSTMLHPLVRDKSVTAVIASSDADAVKYHTWLSAAGIVVPRHLSIISFDNYACMPPPSVSTVDFGFGFLGYAAFHRIMGDVPIRADSKGVVSARPEVIHRGSIAEPRKRPIPVDLTGDLD